MTSNENTQNLSFQDEQSTDKLSRRSKTSVSSFAVVPPKQPKTTDKAKKSQPVKDVPTNSINKQACDTNNNVELKNTSSCIDFGSGRNKGFENM